MLDEFEMIRVIRNMFLPLNERFSSITDVNDKGVHCWKKVDVKVEDHIVVPVFPDGLSTIEYDKALTEYVAKIACEPLPLNKPFWEIHVVKYPTMNGAGSVMFKLSHVIGDGYSIMGVLFRVFRRADDPSLPLTLPNMSLSMNKLGNNSFRSHVSKCINTFSDLTLSLLKGSISEDSKSGIRSGIVGVEFEPIAISSIFIPLDRLKVVKSKVRVTVNDVVTGVLYYIIHLYMVKTRDISCGKNMNLLVMFNTRMLRGYKSIDEMMKANIWGNHVSLLVVPVPCLSGDQKVDPLYFVTKAKEIMKKKKNSLFTYLTSIILKVLTSIRGPMAGAKFLQASFRNTTATISNLIGPVEKMAMAGHPVDCYLILLFWMQSLVFNTVSYKGQLRLIATTEKNFIDTQVFNSCMREAFNNIYDAACL
ncbi:hypothetical protein AQUCO_00700584v1 [Aquilegia coerulea]|uniref:Uncharacterized protein n=1 Tax=Aquilegia coerulea TaxID=218851 RepID=A0A2G5EKR9_AQUCA|nr:hypothetical protein AQUCO_00700584v1 [Aquilegia coerulea]